MLFLIVFMMLFSPLGLALAQNDAYELFQTDAITLDLGPLAEMLTNMRAFEDAAKAVYAEYFIENHFNSLGERDLHRARLSPQRHQIRD
jgi:hypothetical protein